MDFTAASCTKIKYINKRIISFLSTITLFYNTHTEINYNFQIKYERNHKEFLSFLEYQ